MTAEEGESGPKGEASGALEFGWEHMLQQLIDDRRATVLRASCGRCLWVSAERLHELQLVYPDAPMEPSISGCAVGSAAEWTRDDAVRELLRSRLEALGPVTAARIAEPLGLSASETELALLALEQEGFAMRGSYSSPPVEAEEWCERRLLARINRYTVRKLRKEIQPVSPAEFMRFLFVWHGMGEDRGQGPESLRAALGKLEGFPAPAAAWERSLLPARVEHYSKTDLDQIVGSGIFLWLRPALDTSRLLKRAAPVRNTPIVLLARQTVTHWNPIQAPAQIGGSLPVSARAARIQDVLQARGASFFTDLVHNSGLLRTEVELALSELVALGLVTADSFAGLRALIRPAGKRGRRRHRLSVEAIDSAGRWDLIGRLSDESAGAPDVDAPDPADIQHIARVLLNRYGTVFRGLLIRESRRLPPWRDLARIYRRMEARGEIRGGRFVTGVTGEQFALPDAVDTMRAVRRQNPDDHSLVIDASDPLNLSGILTSGRRVPAGAANRLLYRNGIVVAVQAAGEFQWLGDPDPEREWAARNLLLRQSADPNYLAPAQRLS